ncbi:metalloregulator ArsR/SmtB family transcription factor [Sphingomonas aquatica]|uniref:metalloregulator ArsR/SmtB family transcription factor n=2 Tax=Sphingomonas TaxID=13687 RepID=UPI00082AFDCA
MSDETDREKVMAERLASLGAPIRLRIIRTLVRAGDDGVPVGELQRKLGLAASTHAHHLAAMVKAGLVLQERRGREVICTAAFDAVRSVGAYLIEHCCADTATENRSEAA